MGSNSDIQEGCHRLLRDTICRRIQRLIYVSTHLKIEVSTEQKQKLIEFIKQVV